MDDSVQLNAELFSLYYARGYSTWQRLYRKAVACRGFPVDLVDFEHAFHYHPYFHGRLELKSTGSGFLATGATTWRAGDGSGPCQLAPFQRPYSIPVTARRRIVVSVEPAAPEVFPTWCGSQSNHVGILTLGWAYVLAAQWAEIVPGATSSLEYTGSSAGWNEPSVTSRGAISVDLGPASDGAARWWAAILAPNQGWTTGIRHEADLLLAPWSTDFAQTETPFVLSRTSAAPIALSGHKPPSFWDAAYFISAPSAHHGVEDQSRAAFAAALMLPSAGRIRRKVSLPTPRPRSLTGSNKPPANQLPRVALWGNDVHHLDKLLTLSCNNFIQSLLSSVVFEPGIPCNACGAWVQGAFAVIDASQQKDNLQPLTGALMARNPKLGFLWLGATLLGVHEYMLGWMRALFYPVDLTLAAWTGASMSFMQEPVGHVPLIKGVASRADECRLMYLSQSMDHTHPPNLPFQPFGTTAVGDCNLEVQEHARCGGRHGLYYSGWTWDCRGGPLLGSPPGNHPALLEMRSQPERQEENGQVPSDETGPVDYSRMDREKDASEGPTRSIFMWLWETDGFPVAEREIREHEWIDNLRDSDDDESDSPEGDGRSSAGRRNVDVGAWIARTATYRRDSFY